MRLSGISRTALVAGLIGAGAMGAVLVGPQFPPADARPIMLEAPLGAPVSFADLIEQVSPAVVGVSVRTEIPARAADQSDGDRLLEQFGIVPRREAPAPREGRGQGSGFFISESGHIVTNNHVIDKAVDITVTLDDGTELAAELIGKDADTDLAVLKVVEDGTYPYVDFGSSTGLRRGDWVVAVGSPLGFSGTATAGIISAKGKPGDLRRSQTYTDYLQIDAAINRGNSGGPTFDMNGRVIGVNTWIASTTGGSIGLGFAIPSELVETVTESLIEKGKVSRGYLGVLIGNVTEDMATAIDLKDGTGAIVSQVTKGGPADKAGMQRGDIIIKVNGVSVQDATATTRAVGRLSAGSRNAFEILRDGKLKEITVILGERPGNVMTSELNPDMEPEVEPDAGMLGVILRPLDEETREALDLRRNEAGMLIVDISASSPLYAAGLREGMVILDVNNTKLTDIDVLEDALATARESGRNRLLLAVHNRQTGTGFITVDVGEDD